MNDEERAVLNGVIDGMKLWHPPALQFGALELWVLIGTMQLALRHPGNIGKTAAIARRICDRLIDALPTEQVRRAARLGYDPKHDTEG